MIVIVALALVWLVWFFLTSHAKKQPGYDTRYYDKYSGETISTITSKTPESYGTDTSAPIFLGFHELIDHGFSQVQLTGVETAIQKYISANRPATKDISMDVKSFKRLKTGANGGTNLVSFNVVFDFKELHPAELESSGGNEVTLRLYDKSKQKIFEDSYDPGSYDQQPGDE
jgi:hypothetical protein